MIFRPINIIWGKNYKGISFLDYYSNNKKYNYVNSFFSIALVKPSNRNKKNIIVKFMSLTYKVKRLLFYEKVLIGKPFLYK
jgi:hypothetical protein